MCVIQNLTVHNCTTHSLHNLLYNIKATAEYDKSYIHLFMEEVRSRRESDALGVIKDGKIVYYTYGEIEKMVRKMGMFMEHVCNEVKKGRDGGKSEDGCNVDSIDRRSADNSVENIKSVNRGDDSPAYTDYGKLFSNRSCVGIFINNCIEWTVTDLSLILTNKISTTIYATFGRDNVKGIIEQGNVKVVVAGVKEVEMLRNIKCLRAVIVVGKERGVEIDGVEVYYYDDVMSGLEDEHGIRKGMHGTDYAHKHNVGYSSTNYAHNRPDKTINNRNETHSNGKLECKMECLSDMPPLPASADDITTIIYSSGTTGTPKPIPLSHRNIYTSIFALKYGRSTNKFVGINAGDHHLSFLPLAHVMERLLLYCFLLINVKVVFYSGDRKKLMDDIRLVRPTIFCGAPRLWEVIRDGIYSKLGFMSRLLFKFLLFIKRRSVLKDVYTHEIADFFAFNRIKHMFGGRVRLLFSGSAFLDRDLKIFMESVLGVPMYEAYGLTETTGGVTTSTDKCGVGWPLFSDEIRIVDGELVVKGDNVCTRLEDDNYYGDDDKVWERWIEQEKMVYEQNMRTGCINVGGGDNEVKSSVDQERNSHKSVRMGGDSGITGAVNGNSICDSAINFKDGRTNRKNEELCTSSDKECDKTNTSAKNEEIYDNGTSLFQSTKWFRTGDNAIMVNGNIHIVSRLKNNFKTIQGEYIVPERIENVFKSMCTTFTDIFVTGDTKHSFVVALVMSENTSEEVQNEIQRIAQVKKKEGNLFGFEVPKHVYLVKSKFCDLEGCITASTGKLCRKGVEKMFLKEISEMMARG